MSSTVPGAPAPMSNGVRLTLVAIVALAFGLRLTGLTFGLPAVYNPDEIAIMSRALAFAKGDLNPHNFLYPTFYFYVLFAWIGAYFAGSWVLGVVPSVSAFQTQFFVDPSGIYLAGRTLSVVCGAATVWVVFLLGRRLFDERAGLAAALFAAVAPAAVRDAHYVKHDVPVTLAIVAAYLAIVSLPRQPRLAILAGALCGVAFSTHYYTIFLVVPLAVAIWLARGEPSRAFKDVLVAGAAAALVFFALSPFLLVEPATAWQDIVANRQIVMDRAVAGERGLFASAGTYARLLWSEAVGWPVVVAAAPGMVLLARARLGTLLLLLAFPLPFLAFISNTVAAGRYLNPVVPFVALFAGYAISRLSARLPRGALVATGAMLALALPGMLLSWQIGRFFQQTDTRTLAQRYIEAHVPAGSTVLVQPYSVQLTQSRDSLREALAVTLGDPARASTKFAMRLALEPYPAPAYRTLFLGDGGLDADKIYVSLGEVDGSKGLEPLRRLGVEYVVLKQYNAEDRLVAPLRASLGADGQLLTTLSPYRSDADAGARARVAPFLHNTDTPYDRALARPGPGMEIWRLGPVRR